jgi:hypothetical protein
MKVIITESRLLDIAKKWLAQSYGDLTPVSIKYYPSDFFLQHGMIVFTRNVSEGSVVVDTNPDRVYFGSFEHVELDEI